jgi:hypothetical protein
LLGPVVSDVFAISTVSHSAPVLGAYDVIVHGALLHHMETGTGFTLWAQAAYHASVSGLMEGASCFKHGAW